MKNPLPPAWLWPNRLSLDAGFPLQNVFNRAEPLQVRKAQDHESEEWQAVVSGTGGHLGVLALLGATVVDSRITNWYLAISASALALFVVSRLEGRVSRSVWRSLVDMTLLTPILAIYLPNFR